MRYRGFGPSPYPATLQIVTDTVVGKRGAALPYSTSTIRRCQCWLPGMPVINSTCLGFPPQPS